MNIYVLWCEDSAEYNYGRTVYLNSALAKLFSAFFFGRMFPLCWCVGYHSVADAPTKGGILCCVGVWTRGLDSPWDFQLDTGSQRGLLSYCYIIFKITSLTFCRASIRKNFTLGVSKTKHTTILTQWAKSIMPTFAESSIFWNLWLRIILSL